jgi:hypothetical protein
LSRLFRDRQLMGPRSIGFDLEFVLDIERQRIASHQGLCNLPVHRVGDDSLEHHPSVIDDDMNRGDWLRGRTC